ncbi:DUF898 family protein [Phenylobacterium sp. Root700]|uniref:DUF898 family protein n=1 Tax=Phenylobacterium sp. Root700 TaxID=1736591 RepID=UPI0006F65C41|nr:DUF898 family protein [Phenylobacterium sp. Root700]KRB52085.1 hypothetical protein ASE02_13175 [Phenylobacterium sp. Root700]
MSRSDAAVELDGQGLTFVQSIEPRGFLWLSLKHGLLNLVTLTTHRFWGQSEVRRWIWNATDLDGEPLDYVGGGLELFLGFLLKVLTIGGPLLAAVLAVQAWGPLWGAPVAAAAWLIIAFIDGFGRFGAFLYMASRTEWRGENFELEGSPLAFALAHMRDASLCLATFGWWQPVAHRRQAQSLWGGLTFQGRNFRFDMAASNRSPVYSAYAIGWFGTVMVLLFGAGVLLGLASGFFPTPEVGAAPSIGQLLALFALTVGLWVLLTVIWAPYQAARRTSIAAGLGFALPIGWGDMARLNAVNAFLRFASLGVLAPVVQARTSAFLLARLRGTLTAQ